MLLRRRVLVLGSALAAAALMSGCGDRTVPDGEAEQAQALEAELAPLGVTVPEGVASTLYGTDGGVPCALAAGGTHHLARHGVLVGRTGALRKVDVSADAVAAARAVITVYCPDELPTFDDYTDSLSISDED